MSGKRLLVLLLAGLLLLIGLLFYWLGPSAWRLWNIPVMSPTFADTRSILSGLDAARLGYDPLSHNPLDSFGRVMAYPRLWLLLRFLPLGEAQTLAVAAAEIGLFLVALLLFVDALDRWAALCIAALVVSPAAMLCFERGNTDLLAFFLLACALAVLSRSRLISMSLIELAAFLKLYPILALGWLVRESRRTLLPWALAGIAAFGLYAALTWRDIDRILSNASKGAGFNYGVTVLGVWAYDLSGSRSVGELLFAFSYLAAFALLVVVLYRVDRDRFVFSTPAPRLIDAFRVGALIYLGTFLQGNTWNYRLLFLIFTVPQLFEWARAAQPPAARIARTALILILLSAWSPLFGAVEPPVLAPVPVVQLLLDELLNWSLFVCLAYVLIASLPQWLRAEITLFFQKYRRARASLLSSRIDHASASMRRLSSMTTPRCAAVSSADSELCLPVSWFSTISTDASRLSETVCQAFRRML